MSHSTQYCVEEEILSKLNVQLICNSFKVAELEKECEEKRNHLQQLRQGNILLLCVNKSYPPKWTELFALLFIDWFTQPHRSHLSFSRHSETYTANRRNNQKIELRKVIHFNFEFFLFGFVILSLCYWIRQLYESNISKINEERQRCMTYLESHNVVWKEHKELNQTIQQKKHLCSTSILVSFDSSLLMNRWIHILSIHSKLLQSLFSVFLTFFMYLRQYNHWKRDVKISILQKRFSTTKRS